MNIKEWWMPDAQQTAFRALMNGFARPGTLVELGSGSMDAALVFLATLLDESVTLADTADRLDVDLRRVLMAPTAPVANARFVLADGGLAPGPDFAPSLGSLESPEFGATVLLTVGHLAATPLQSGAELSLRGPGIQGERIVHVAGLQPAWLERREQWVSAFPLGIELVLCAKNCLVALPRTTRIEIGKN